MNIKEFLRCIIYLFGFLLYYSGLFYFIIELRRRRAKIITYHDITDKDNPFIKGMNISLSTQTFRKQLSFIYKYYNVVSLHKVVSDIKHNSPKKKQISITFDDGYKSFKKNAFPILIEFSFPSTIFLVSKCLIDKKFMWKNILRFLCNKYSEEETISIVNKILNKRGLLNSVSTVKKIEDLQTYYSKDTLELICDELIKNFYDQIKEELNNDNLYLTIEDCKKFPIGLVKIGNHSYFHYLFSKLTEKEIDKEIVQSCKLLKNAFGFSPNFFAYPQGIKVVNANIVEEIAKANSIGSMFYASGCDNKYGSDLYKLDR